MPLFTSFSAISAKGLGMTSGFPPGAPVINTSSSTATTLTINFTSTPGSFTISKFEYSLNGAAYTGNISGNAVTYEFTGLIPSTSYTVAIRAVDASTQTSPNSNTITRSTTAEIAPSAPAVTVTQKESTGTPINATRLDVSFGAASAGTYPVAYYQYQVYRGAILVTDWTTTPVGAGTTFTLQSLTPSSSHTVYVRGVATGNGTTYGSSGSGTATTDTEIAPSAPTVTVTQKESTGTPINATKLDVSFGTAAAGTYPVVYYQYSVYRGATLVTDWTTTPVGTGTTFTLTGLLHNASHTVYVRGVATANGTTFGTQGSGTASTDAEIINSAPTVTINSVTTTNVTFTRGSSSGGTYGVSKYRYQIKNGSGTVVSGPFDLTNASTQFTEPAGVGPDAIFSVEVWAISSTSGTAGSIGSASGQLDPNTPAVPTLSFASEGASERGSAFLSWNAQTYATTYHVYRNGVFYSATSSTTMTVTGHSAGTPYTYRVYAGNRLGNFSASSNVKSMTTGATGVSWSMTSGTSSPVRYFGTTVSCDAYIGSLYIDIGSVPTNSGDAGYKYIQTIGYEVAQIPGSTLAYTSLANRRLYFLISGVAQSPPTGWEASGVATIIRREVPQHGLDTNFALDFYTNGVLLGGSNISNTRISVTPDGVNWADYVTCQENVVDNLNTSIRGRNLYITGYQTTATTYA